MHLGQEQGCLGWPVRGARLGNLGPKTGTFRQLTSPHGESGRYQLGRLAARPSYGDSVMAERSLDFVPQRVFGREQQEACVLECHSMAAGRMGQAMKGLGAWGALGSYVVAISYWCPLWVCGQR